MKIYFVDSFTSERFKGNPAAVCLAKERLNDALMQNIATEIGFSETAFLHRATEHVYDIRFFTPKTEIPLCGHATLASAKIIFDTFDYTNVTFVNIDGVKLAVNREGDDIRMQFPVYSTTPMNIPHAMQLALGVETIADGRYNAETKIILIQIASAERLRLLKPDFVALKNSFEGIDGVLVTSPPNTEGFDYHYRYFWPWAGTDEDPVTGAVQTFLAKYWSEKLNKKKLRAFQASKRTGEMTVEWLGDNKVVISGNAVLTLAGEFMI